MLLLPAARRYEIPGGVTETTTERRVVLSPEIPGPRIAEARPEGEVLLERVRPAVADRLQYPSTAAIREEIAEVVPLYAGIEKLRRGGDSFQYGGPRLCEGSVFPTADGKARFSALRIGPTSGPDGRLRLSTRRGKQFNSMVQERRDGLTGAARDAVLICEADASQRGLGQGDDVLLRSDTGEMQARVHFAPIAPGNVQLHWPEGNILIGAGRRSPEAGIPDYNAEVSIHRL